METWFAPVNGLDVALQKAGAPSSYEGLIATECRGLKTFNGANKQLRARKHHVLSSDTSSLKIAVGNFRLIDTSSNELGSGGTSTISASVEYPAGVYTQIAFGGSPTITVASGGVAWSDYTAGDLAIPAGATFWIRQFIENPVGVLFNPWRNSAAGDLVQVAASGLTDTTMGGTITSSGDYSHPPLLIIGQTEAASVCVIGDSKAHGYLDTAESTSAAGPGLRGEICKSFPDTLPFLNMATGGMRANLWATEATSRKQLLAPFSHYVIQLGHNDFMISGDSAATVQANIEAIIAEILVANPAAKITISTPGHKSASTSGNWISDADQTTSGGNAARVTYCGTVRASGVAGQNNGFFEVAAQLESTLNNGLWKSDGVTPDLYTADGVHETPAGYDLIVSAGAIDLGKFAYP